MSVVAIAPHLTGPSDGRAPVAGRLVESWSGTPLTETSTLEARADAPVASDRLLRRLEVLRQRLSIRWCGSSGAFAGYDALKIADTGAIVAGMIQLSARMVSAERGSHTVEFLATRGSEPTSEVLVSGRGRSLDVRVAAKS
jgi:hypothetical protein